MRKLLYINVNIRKDESRTKRIADAFLNKVKGKYQIEEINLDKLNISPKDNAYFKNTNINANDVKLAKLVASADKILISTPFWDMSFPSKLKVFIERATFPGITMSDSDDMRGVSGVEEILVITTRGWDIQDYDELDGISSYMKGLQLLWGIEKYHIISANGLDVHLDKVDELVDVAIEKAKEYAQFF